MTDLRPFQRVPFDELPATPRVPHGWHQARGERVTVRSAHFGALAIHHRVTGRGPPLLLVHGLMTTSYSWRYVLAPLGEHFTVYAPDLPGCGRSDKPAERSFAPGHLAAFLVEYQRAVGVAGCRAIGNSMGGYLCLRAALERPGAFARLVDMHSPGVPQARLFALRAATGLPGAFAALRGVVARDPLRFVHRHVHYYDETLKSLEEAREYAATLRDPAGLRCFVRYLRETMDPFAMRPFVAQLAAMRARGAPFPVPLQLLYARADPMVPPRTGRELAALIPSAQLVWLERSSHFAHVDTPGAVLDAALPFLRGS